MDRGIISSKVHLYYDSVISTFARSLQAFDPVMAHTILSARPHLLSRNPPEVRSLLKYLYGSIVTAMASIRQDTVEVDFTQGK